jgi:hypothetical protein
MRGITFEKVWSDEHVVEFEITTLDGCSQFFVKVYAGPDKLESLVEDLKRFVREVYGGIYDVEFGKFGPEYAGGAFHVRLHLDTEGQLFVTVHAESDWYSFSCTHVASRATLYLRTELGLLDRFIDELRQVSSGSQDKAALECV